MNQRLKDFAADFWDANKLKVYALLWALLAGAVGAITNQEVRAPLTVEKEVVKEVIKEVQPNLTPDDPRNFPNGWNDNQDEVKAAVAAMNPPVFGNTPAGQVTEIPKAVYAWKFYTELPNVRGPPPTKNQGGVGSCVSFGTNGAIEKTLAAYIASGHRNLTWARFAEEATYAFSRVEIGGGRIRGDGSVGAWAAAGSTKKGLLPRAKYGDVDLTTYSEGRCRSWGQTGVPDDLEPEAAKWKVATATQVRTTKELQQGMANGYFTAICSNVGFNDPNGSIGTRDARGVIMPRGSWAHCMHADGYHTDADGTVYIHITNSWGPNAHRGPVGWGDPPTDGFWTPATVVQRMLDQNDSWMFSGVPGFPQQQLPDFFIRHDRTADRAVPVALAFPRRRQIPNMEWSLAH